MTTILKINPKVPEKHKIKIASNFIKKGELVVFPTETVYGIGANALDKKAVKKIFKAKGRPSDNPLIVHIANKNEINNLVKNIPKIALRLIDKFWPGPLTLVLEKKNIIPNEVTANLKTIAIRMPNNKIALELIKESGCSLAAPSANLSSKPSGTSIKHIIQDFNGKIPYIIDGGNSKIGLESTVINLTTTPPQLLRPGHITFEQLKKYLPKIKIYKEKSKKPASPGMKYRHYAPKAKVIITKNKKDIDNIKIKYRNKKIKVIKTKNIRVLAKNLFRIFRECDDKHYDLILIPAVEEKGLGLALMNRLKKAASKH